MAERQGGRRGQLRIIGGQWRGRKLPFQVVEGLRPTPDRVRETLFNWLTATIPAARCLDLFAGSGALGLEALSRGAAHCDFVERDRHSAKIIEGHLHQLDCDRGVVWRTDARQWLEQVGDRGNADSGGVDDGQGEGQTGLYDIVFLDPPFAQGLASVSCMELEKRQLLAPAAHIYVETGIREAPPTVPDRWTPVREKQAGEVRYQLFGSNGG